MICGTGCDIQNLSMVEVAANYRNILDRIHQAASRSGRDPGEIKLLAASKAQSVSLIRQAIEAGVRLIGENYVQEAKEKKSSVHQPVEWHMIGHLQRNKVKAALGIFDLIETLDSVELARELNKEGKKRDRKVRTFIEVNLAGEETKSGLPKDRVEDLLRAVSELSHVTVEGLMAVPPFRENPEEVRPYFRTLKEMFVKLKGLNLANAELKELSMGMTHDYAVAVEEGATIVRIGTALFGPRRE